MRTAIKTGTERVTHADIDYIADALKDAGLIEYKWLFKAFCRISHADTKVAPGEYELKSNYDYQALIRHMSPFSGGALTVKVTFPEGLNMRQMFLLLEENGVSKYDDLMAAAADYKFNYDFLDELPQGDASRLEGYLFPDTYEFYVNMQPASAINKFLETFYYSFDEEMQQQLEASGRDMREIVIIASMIEKEAANDEERALIASVIYNRLNTGMPLGIDATILYIHPEHEGAPTAEMLAEDSPYNTRDRIGLPPTPICNPGLASLKAALNPASTNYYYTPWIRRREHTASSPTPMSSTPLWPPRTMADKTELLSPAGDRERLMMAIFYGADAVYLAGRQFGMRSSVVNFSDEDMRWAVRYAHARGVKIYVTCNTLPRGRGAEGSAAYLEFLQDAGVDGLIIADLGVLELAKRHAPRVAKHVSTQFGVINSATANAPCTIWARTPWYWRGRRRWRTSGRSGPIRQRSFGWKPLSTALCA